jgi:hypothetical protein
MVPSGNMGRQKRDGNNSPPLKKLLQVLEGKEENGYPDPHSKKIVCQRTQ